MKIILFIKKITASEYLSLVLRVYIGSVFITAAMAKLPYPAEFVEALAAYRIAPYVFVNFSAVGAVIINLFRGTPISCGCFDTVGEAISWWTVARDLSWVLLTLQIFFFDRVLQIRRVSLFSKRN